LLFSCDLQIGMEKKNDFEVLQVEIEIEVGIVVQKKVEIVKIVVDVVDVVVVHVVDVVGDDNQKKSVVKDE